jgi:hypothetical protein
MSVCTQTSEATTACTKCPECGWHIRALVWWDREGRDWWLWCWVCDRANRWGR